jgi:hypothetical protein
MIPLTVHIPLTARDPVRGFADRAACWREIPGCLAPPGAAGSR